MLDPKLLRQDVRQLAEKLRVRGYQLDLDKYQKLEDSRRALQHETESLQSRRNSISKKIGVAKSEGKVVQELMDEVSSIADQLKSQQTKLAEVQTEFNAFLGEIPNIAHRSVPVGNDEGDNIEVKRWGEPRNFDFDCKDHVDLGEDLGYMDYESASNLAGARFVVLRNSLARLHRALAQFMMDLHVEMHGYLEVNIPLLVNPKALFGTGQLPKFADDQFSTQGTPLYYLIPTAEVPLTNLVANSIIEDGDLPMRFVAHTACFRREAGSYGRDTRGMIRQHQFEKVEMVHIARPSESYECLEMMRGHAETVLQKLGLPYRVITLCTGDMGFSAAKTYDLEVWLPGQGKYREISSCSNTESFQARRMKARWRNPESGKPELLHTLNGSGVAVGRAMVAVMENYQNKDGSICVPEVLKKYLSGLDVIN